MKADTICCYCSVESRLADIDGTLFVSMQSHCYEKVLQLVHKTTKDHIWIIMQWKVLTIELLKLDV